MPDEEKQRREGADLGGISAELKKARTRAGISHSELNRVTGISRTVLIGYEAGRTKPGTREIRLLCDALKITPNRLIYGKDKPFSVEAGPWLDLVDSDDRAAIRLMVLFKMLARDERGAITTLVHSLLVARHGKPKMDEATAILKLLEDNLPELVGDLGQMIEQKITPDKVASFEAKVKTWLAQGEKPGITKSRQKKNKG